MLTLDYTAQIYKSKAAITPDDIVVSIENLFMGNDEFAVE